MTDHKAIEAAAREIAEDTPAEWNDRPNETRFDGYPMTRETVGRDAYRKVARAAIAAADKVRAEGFDADSAAEEILSKTCDSFSCLAAAKIELRRAFAAGLAKGDADRAALVEALTEVRDGLSDVDAKCFAGTIAKIGVVLALVRKGE